MLHCATPTPTTRRGPGMRPREPWINRKTAAELLGIDETTLHRWVKAGHLADVRTWQSGAYRYYHRTDIEALARRLEAGPTSDTDK